MSVLFVLEVVDLFEEVRDGGVLGECAFVVASESVHFVVFRESQGVMLSGGHLDNVLVLQSAQLLECVALVVVPVELVPPPEISGHQHRAILQHHNGVRLPSAEIRHVLIHRDNQREFRSVLGISVPKLP